MGNLIEKKTNTQDEESFSLYFIKIRFPIGIRIGTKTKINFPIWLIFLIFIFIFIINQKFHLHHQTNHPMGDYIKSAKLTPYLLTIVTYVTE